MKNDSKTTKPNSSVDLEKNRALLETARVERVSNGIRDLLSNTDEGQALIRSWDKKTQTHQKDAHISQDLEKIKKMALN